MESNNPIIWAGDDRSSSHSLLILWFLLVFPLLTSVAAKLLVWFAADCINITAYVHGSAYAWGRSLDILPCLALPGTGRASENQCKYKYSRWKNGRALFRGCCFPPMTTGMAVDGSKNLSHINKSSDLGSGEI